MIKFECPHCGFEMSSNEEGQFMCDSCYKSFYVHSDGYTQEDEQHYEERQIKTSDGERRTFLFPKA